MAESPEKSVATVGPASTAGPASAAAAELVDPAAVLTTSRRLVKASGACFGAGLSTEPDAPGAELRGLLAAVAGLLVAAELLMAGVAVLLATELLAAEPLPTGVARLLEAGFGRGALSRASGAGHGSLPRAAPSLWLNRSIARSSAASALAASPRALASRRPCWWAETSTTRVPGSACTRRACSCIGLPGGQ